MIEKIENDICVYSKNTKKDKTNTIYLEQGRIIPEWNNGKPYDRRERRDEFLYRANSEINDLILQEEWGQIEIKHIQFFNNVYDDCDILSCIIIFKDLGVETD